MTEETVDCFNCGRANPEWAQVCRSCGVALRHGAERVAPGGRLPTDRDSLISLAAVIGTIVLGVLIGLFFSGLNPTEPTTGVDPSPTATATAEPTEQPIETEPAGTQVAEATPEPTPGLPGQVVFGTQLDGNSQVIEPVETFTPGMTFAHSISMSQPFGTDQVNEEIVRINEDGTDGEQIVAPEGNALTVNPEGTSAGWVATDAANFVRDWGTGLYEMRVYAGDQLIARGQFRLAEG